MTAPVESSPLSSACEVLDRLIGMSEKFPIRRIAKFPASAIAIGRFRAAT